jgi:DNA-binding NarL/FixJ family response regulator
MPEHGAAFWHSIVDTLSEAVVVRDERGTVVFVNAAAERFAGIQAPDAALVMLTGHGDDAVLRVAVGAGCTGFVTKDDAVVDLVRAIRAVHDGVAALDAQRVARLARPAGMDAQRGPSALTDRELEVLWMLAEGASTHRIAERLFISVNTARNHVQRVIRKLDAHSRLEAVAAARRAGLLGAPRS